MVEEWNDGDDTRVIVKALGQDPLADVWCHEGKIDVRFHNENASKFIITGISNWLKSDFRRQMPLEQFLDQLFPT